MKKLISAILALTMMLALVACGGANNNNTGDNGGNNTNVNQNAGSDNTGNAGNAGNDNGGEDTNAPTNQFDAPDLNQYVENFLLSLGEDNAPFMMPADPDTLEAFYAGLGAIATKQCVVQLAAMSSVAYEFALIECENEADVEAVKTILEARKAYQVDGGAWYPETMSAWENAEIIVQGNFVALIQAGEQTADAVAAFNGLFATTW